MYTYNWEATYTNDLTLEALRQHCVSIAKAMLQVNARCLVAYDTRFLSYAYALEACRILISQGVVVQIANSNITTPMAYLLLEQRRCDVVLFVSGANHPFWVNGLRIISTTALRDPLLPDKQVTFVSAAGFPSYEVANLGIEQIEARNLYIQSVRTIIDCDLIRRSALTLFVDSMNGSAGGVVSAIFGEGSQSKAIEINRDPDPMFGKQPPHPWESSLGRLRKLVRESDSHMGVAISADGCSLGVIDNTGELVLPNDVALVIATYLSSQYRQRGQVLLPNIKSGMTKDVRLWEEKYVLKIESVANVDERLRDIITRERSGLLAGTTASGEITIGRYSTVADACLAACMLTEMLARTGRKLRPMIEELQHG